MIDFSIKPEKLGEITVEEARDHQELVETLNYFIDEGFVQIEQGLDEEIRLYST